MVLYADDPREDAWLSRNIGKHHCISEAVTDEFHDGIWPRLNLNHSRLCNTSYGNEQHFATMSCYYCGWSEYELGSPLHEVSRVHRHTFHRIACRDHLTDAVLEVLALWQDNRNRYPNT